MDELEPWLILASAPGLHAAIFHRLTTELGAPERICAASRTKLIQIGLSEAQAEAVSAPDRERLQDDRKWLAESRHSLVLLGSAEYPPLLAQLSDAPIALYVEGEASVLKEPQLAIVGSRNPTPSGRETAHDFAAHLARCGLTITSGLALGIDAASHRGALDADGHTLAVCGTGLDIAYPRAHADLAREIAAHGALVSEFPLGTPPLKLNFPRRNRLISGLSLGTLVVEAAVRSGSLITARLAGDQGREVFAIPGSIHNALARGCHQLIRQGAKLVETADDILSELGSLAAVTGVRIASKSADTQSFSAPLLDKEYEILLDALGFEPASVDRLVERTGLRADEIASMLLILELESHVESYPGGLYVRARPRMK
jgi:DNA processing protein